MAAEAWEMTKLYSIANFMKRRCRDTSIIWGYCRISKYYFCWYARSMCFFYGLPMRRLWVSQ